MQDQTMKPPDKPEIKEESIPASDHKRKYEFPYKLYCILEAMEKHDTKDVISWLPDGKAFKIHNVEAFANEVLPKFCNGIQYKSFVRNINLYRFERIKDGKSPVVGAYFHPMFTRDNLPTVLKMVRPKRPRKDGRKARIDKTKEFRRKAASTGSLHLSQLHNTNLQTPGPFCLPEELMAGMNHPQLSTSTSFYPGATMNPLTNTLRGVVSWSSGGSCNNQSSIYGALQQNQSFRLSNPHLSTPASKMKLGKGLASDLMNDLVPRPIAPRNSKIGTTENHHMTTTALSSKSTGSLLSSSISSTTAAATTVKALHMPPPLLNSIEHTSMMANNNVNMTQQSLNPSSPQGNNYFNSSLMAHPQIVFGDGSGCGGSDGHNKTSSMDFKTQQHSFPNGIRRHQNLASNIRQQDSEWMVNVVSNYNVWGKNHPQQSTRNDATTTINAAGMARSSPQNHRPSSNITRTRDTSTFASGFHLRVHSTGDSSVNSNAWSVFPEGDDECSEAALLRSLEDCTSSDDDEQKLTFPAENDKGGDDNNSECSSIGGFLDDLSIPGDADPGDAEQTFRLRGDSSIFGGGERVATPLDTLDENMVSDWYERAVSQQYSL